MWPNGDMTESEAYRASRRFVTGGAQAGVAAPQGRGAGEELSCRHQPWTGPRQLAVRAVHRPPPPSQAARAGGERPDRAGRRRRHQPGRRHPADRPPGRRRPCPPRPSAGDQNANAGQDQAIRPTRRPGPADQDRPGPDPNAAGRRRLRARPGERRAPAYITKVSNSRIVVDDVQVFHDDAAVKAAIADGKSPAGAKYLTTWVRNENSRLRTLPLAGDLDIQLGRLRRPRRRPPGPAHQAGRQRQAEGHLLLPADREGREGRGGSRSGWPSTPADTLARGVGERTVLVR